jgi:Glycosyltransferase family 17
MFIQHIVPIHPASV